MASNPGKQFEAQFEKSIPNNVYCYRLKDSAQSYNKTAKFTWDNPCDFFIYNHLLRLFCGFELKSTKETSISFWREDFEDDSQTHKYMVRKNQIVGMDKIAQKNGVAGLIVNWRFTNHTYFWSITDFLAVTDKAVFSKKSFNEADMITGNAILMDQTLLRKNYRYDIEKLLSDIHDREEK